MLDNYIAYFDNAATTFPKPDCVYDYMDSFYRSHGCNVGRGQYKLSSVASKLINDTRKNLQDLLSCHNKDVIFSSSATIALNIVLQGILNQLIGRQIVPNVYVSPFEHNSVTRILHHYEKQNKINVVEINVSENFTYDLNNIDFQFRGLNPDLIVISHASNVMGLISPILKIFKLAKKYESVTVTDMAQTAGLVPLDVASDLIDFAVFEGHKTLYGPMGIGGFVKKSSYDLMPVLFGGTGVDSANQDMPFSIPFRYEPGTQNIQAISGLSAALKWWILNSSEIRNKENENHRKLVDLLSHYDFIRIVGPSDRFSIDTPCIGVVSTLFENYTSDEIGNVLDELNVAVRTGLECSPMTHKFINTYPEGTVRFSVGYFTCDEDFNRLKNALDYIRDNR